MQLYRIRFTNIHNPEEEDVTDHCYTEEQALLIIEQYIDSQWRVEYFV